MSTKPILFNTDMVRGLLANCKMVTRRVVRPQYGIDAYGGTHRFDAIEVNRFRWSDIPNIWTAIPYPYHPGDILYVRETWCKTDCFGLQNGYVYKANDNSILEEAGFVPKWRRSIHMPREAARIFLRVTDVSACRVQDITDEDARKEGCRDREDFRRVWNECYAKPRPVKDENGIIDHYESYPWEDIHEIRTYRGKPWYVIGNPWVWVIGFERISREEAVSSAD